MAIAREIRVSELLRTELAKMLQHELSDPRLLGVVIASVEVTKDLRQAKVLIRLLAASADAEAQERALKGLASATGFLRKEVAARLQLRHSPDLLFRYDAGLEARLRIDSLLNEIATEKKPK
jgi:ribosome-binding factor A